MLSRVYGTKWAFGRGCWFLCLEAGCLPWLSLTLNRLSYLLAIMGLLEAYNTPCTLDFRHIVRFGVHAQVSHREMALNRSKIT